MAKCKGCGAEIVWVKTHAGKSMPCDPQVFDIVEDPKCKTIYVTEGGRTVRGFASGNGQITLDILPTGRGRVAHWATCPAADEFRR